ncbi:MAG: type III toxin-antitoxin system ToxN/AbiQ family toxin [Firmicutes bacterium]|nr:type III toxin-antitoxin system ToxN/AbiQ family toxin [Bacillota bacterium]
MDIRVCDFGIYNIDVEYLKYLHDNADSEVYFSSEKYETKPFLGLVLGVGTYTYFIPFTSSKPKHLKWKNVASDHYLIYEIEDKERLSDDAICKPHGDGKVKHIIAVLDIKKMIPVPEEHYHKVDFSSTENPTYRSLLEKEYYFCQSIQDGIIDKVTKIYKEQKETKAVRRFYCNYATLEKACDEYAVRHNRKFL